ncbi:MAG: lamin tail domain-containing protein [Sphingobacteriales bacterium]|nr:lamin tail domain-containing protein [Sphingobacteriales bacterium]
MIRFALLLFLCTPVLLAQSPQLVINELMASNSSTAADEAGEYDDWIELYNNSGSDLDIGNYVLTDNNANLTKWKFPNDALIAANSYLIVWADEDSSQGPLHANFKLSAALGEHLMLLDNDGNVLDEVTFGAQSTDQSYARLPNGTGNFAVVSPTFNASNSITALHEPAPAAVWSVFPTVLRRNQTATIRHAAADAALSLCIYNAAGIKLETLTLAPRSEQVLSADHWSSGVYYIKDEKTAKVQIIEIIP